MNIDPATLPESAVHLAAENIAAIQCMADALGEWAKNIKTQHTSAINAYHNASNPKWMREAAVKEANRLHMEQDLAKRLAERLRNSSEVVIYRKEGVA